MGVLTDVFIASEAGLTPDPLERGPLGLVPAVEGKGFDWNAVEGGIERGRGASKGDASERHSISRNARCALPLGSAAAL